MWPVCFVAMVMVLLKNIGTIAINFCQLFYRWESHTNKSLHNFTYQISKNILTIRQRRHRSFKLKFLARCLARIGTLINNLCKNY